MSQKLVVYAVSTTLLLLFILCGGLTFTIWNITWQIDEIQNTLQSLEKNSENHYSDQDLIPILDSLKRISRSAASQSATEILADALTELIENKLYSLMECSKDKDNSTDCSLKPGPKGEKGGEGKVGPKGPKGQPGDPGVKGQKGHYGYPGYKGEAGPQGPVGERGLRGDTGVVGPKGDIGPAGPQGATGERGPQGEPGVKGQKGEHGYPGYKGSIGPKGKPGAQGPTGSKGEPGVMGVKGERGLTGQKGEKGMTGEQGPPGPKGPPEANGTTSSLGSLTNPAKSCRELHDSSTFYASNFYWIKTANVSQGSVKVYCDMDRACCGNATGGWMRVANINMTESTQQCPNGFKLINRTEPPLRACGRPYYTGGCVSTTFPVYGMQYSRVCGRIVGYQLGGVGAFFGYNEERQTLDGYYLGGISLTYGLPPRKHIWSFVNALSDIVTYHDYSKYLCPCSSNSRPYRETAVPPFIADDYFCETGIRDTFSVKLNGQLYPNDPLWDGQGCPSTSTCCEFNNPPWFCKQLPQPTNDDIEMRLCENSHPNLQDSPFEIVEIYIN